MTSTPDPVGPSSAERLTLTGEGAYQLPWHAALLHWIVVVGGVVSETTTLKLAPAGGPALPPAVPVCVPGVADPGAYVYVRVLPLPDTDQPVPNDAAAGNE